LRPVGASDAAAVQELLEASADYYRRCFGMPPTEHEAESELAALPTGATPVQKRVLGVEGGNGELLGMVDEVADWPAPGTLMLGLVLLRPEARDAGLGSSLMDSLESEWRDRGFARVRVGVVGANEGSLRFFRRRGFSDVSSISRDDATHPYEIVVLEKAL
jgi:GNAT superfamily N-acetyltransferase